MILLRHSVKEQCEECSTTIGLSPALTDAVCLKGSRCDGRVEETSGRRNGAMDRGADGWQEGLNRRL